MINLETQEQRFKLLTFKTLSYKASFIEAVWYWHSIDVQIKEM